MTCIVALRHQGKVYMASDSIIVADGVVTRNARKVVSFPGFVVGFAGHFKAKNILDELRSSQKIGKMASAIDARKFAKKVFKKLKAEEESNDGSDDEDDSVSLLIATQTNVYEIDSYLSCVECGEVSGIGTGAPYAKAALRLMLDQKLSDDPRQMLGIAVEIAAQYDNLSGTPAFIEEVTNGRATKKRTGVSKTKRNRKRK